MRTLLLTPLCLALAAAPALAQGNLGTSAQAPGTGMSRSTDTTSPATRDPALSGGQVTDGRSPGPVPGPNNTASTRPNMAPPMGVNPAAGTVGSGNASGATFGSSSSSAPNGVPGAGSGTGVSGAQMGSSTSSVPATPGVAAPTVTNTTGTGGNRPMGQAGTPGSAATGTATGGASAVTNAPVGTGSSTGAATGANATMPTGTTGTATGTGVTNAPVGAAMDNSTGGRNAATADSDRRDGRANVLPSGAPSRGDAPGANSFTEGQARARIEDAGFAQVGQLARDADGVWRGTAMRDGRQVQVGLDFQGTVTHR